MSGTGQATRRAHKRCEHCHQWFWPKQRYHAARFCSNACSAAARGPLFFLAMGRKGGLATKVSRREQRERDLRHRLAGLTVVGAYNLGLRRGYARLTRAKREGYSDGYAAGYEAAMRELRLEVA